MITPETLDHEREQAWQHLNKNSWVPEVTVNQALVMAVLYVGDCLRALMEQIHDQR